MRERRERERERGEGRGEKGERSEERGERRGEAQRRGSPNSLRCSSGSESGELGEGIWKALSSRRSSLGLNVEAAPGFETNSVGFRHRPNKCLLLLLQHLFGGLDDKNWPGLRPGPRFLKNNFFLFKFKKRWGLIL